MSAGARMIADRYRLDEKIGSGAMGVVWRAHDERLDRTVAVKQLLLQPGLSPQDRSESQARAMREGRIAARLQHPHAISVFDVALGPSEVDGRDGEPWLVMEYHPSRSLATVLADNGPLPPREVARIGRQVADALAAAHAAGIVHRDVKPGNVLLGHDGTVKITDFGISRASWDVTVTRTGILAGTPAYFAPEVARGEPPGPASDVFSLGSMLYTAVEGAPPFGQEENTLALLRAVADGRVYPPRQAGPLTDVLMRLLRADPAQRPTMTAARDALGAVGAGQEGATATRRLPAPAAAPAPAPVPAPTPPAPAAAPPWASRPDPAARPTPAPAPAHARPWWRRRAVLVAAVAVLLLALGTLPFVLGGGGGAQPDSALPAGTPAPSTPAPGTAAPPSSPPAPEPTTEEPEPTNTTPPPEPTGAQFEQAARTYYGLLPDQLDQAWSMLGPDVRAQSGSFEAYRDFWSQFSDVSVRDVRADGDTVSVTIVYTEPGGRTFTEPYLLEMDTTDDGRVLITRSEIGDV